MALDEWLRIDGSTPRERMHNGYKQLIVVGLLVWAGVFVVWEFLSIIVGPAAAGVVVVVLGVYVGLDLRDRMIGPLDDEMDIEDAETSEDSDVEESEQETDHAAKTEDAEQSDTNQSKNPKGDS